jgi:competence protein ComEC
MLSIALAFCAGAAAVHALPALPAPPWTLALAAAALCLLRRHPPVAALCLGAAAAILLLSGRLDRDWPCARDREQLTVVGRVIAPAILRPGRTDIDLAIEEADAPGPWPRVARLSWYRATAVPQPGEHWRLSVRLRCRQGFANPGAADRELDLLRQGIGATGYVVDGEAARRLDGRDAPSPIERLRARIAAGIAAAMPAGPSVAVLQGLSVGLRGTVPDELWEAFATTGVAHLMAISGLHVTGCAVFVLLLLRLLWRWPPIAQQPARTAVECALVVTVTAGYAWLAGASLPALRTLAMVGIAGLQRLLRRQLPVHQTLALAALLLCAADPLAVSSAGFWLSFVATAALLAVLQDGSGWRARLAGFARAQAAVTALLTPVLAIVFGRLSLIAPLANAVAIPVFSCVLLPAVLAATVLESLPGGAAAGLWRWLGAALDAAWPPLTAAGSWPFAAWAPPAQPAALVAAAGVLMLLALLLPVRGLRAAAGAAMLAVIAGGSAGPTAGAWSLTVLDVGQGLAAVVETSRHVLLFDTGPRWQSGGAAASVSLLPYLRSRGIRRIDRLLVSHEDLDHAGGAAVIERALAVTLRLDGPGAGAGAGDGSCRRGQRWIWDAVEFEILHPPAGMHGSDNDRSCVLRVSGDGGSALLLADVESAGEQVLAGERLAADVVLLPHHGSRSSSTPALVGAVGARLGIASAGHGNRWGMPVPEVRARWRSAGTTVLTTAEAGAVTVRFAAGPRPLEVRAERADTPHWWRRR